MPVLKQPFILPFLAHKSATIPQIDSSKVSNSKQNPEKCLTVTESLLHRPLCSILMVLLDKHASLLITHSLA